MKIHLLPLYQQILQESKQVGMLYHFRSWTSFTRITNNFTNDNPVLTPQSTEAHLAPKSVYPLYLSMTRKYNLMWNWHMNKFIQVIRLTLDGTKISEKYFVQPFNFSGKMFTQVPEEAEQKHLSNISRSIQSNQDMASTFGDTHHQNEYEERIWLTERQRGFPIREYCLEVVLLLSDKRPTQEEELELKRIISYFEEWNVPVVATSKLAPYGRSKPADLKNFTISQFNNWVKPNEGSLKDEFIDQHLDKGLTYFTRDQFLQALKTAKTEVITPQQDSRILGRTQISPSEFFNSVRLNHLINSRTYRFEKNARVTMPIVIEFQDGTRRIFSPLSNLIMDAAYAHGINPTVFILKSVQDTDDTASPLSYFDISRLYDYD